MAWSEQEPERELLRRAAARDPDAFEALMAPYEQRLWGLCLRMMGNPPDASDMLQEAMLRVWRTLPSFAGQSTLATWLYRVTTNVCLDALRKRKPARETSLEALAAQGGYDPADTTPGPEARAEQDARQQAIRQGLARLSPELRAAFVLRDLEGLRYEDVARALGLSLGTVKSRIHRARVQLAKGLREHGELFFPETVQRMEGGREA